MSRSGAPMPASAPIVLRVARLCAIGSSQMNGGELRFYPHADGSIDMSMWVGSDFRTMEDYLCRWMQPTAVYGGPVACVNSSTVEATNVFE